ncbi:MAG: hypothetical protein ACM359_16795 [Bacillota bacterium]
MTQRYENPADRPQPYVAGASGPNIEMNTAMVSPIDRLRWAAVLGGIFIALSTLVVLSLLGMAVGFSAYDPGDTARSFGIGAGIWGGISVLLAFFVGGWFTARAAAVRGANNGIMNGVMVWAVAIPLMLYLLSSILGFAASQSRGEVDRVIHASVRTDEASQAIRTADPQQKQQVARTGRNAAWGSLISVMLGSSVGWRARPPGAPSRR